MSERVFKRGEIYYADLSPVRGSEQGGTRPVIIVQNDVGNKYSPTVIVVPLTTILTKSKLPTHVVLYKAADLPCKSLVLCEQIKTIDKSRLQDYKGTVSSEDMEKIDKALKISLGMT